MPVLIEPEGVPSDIRRILKLVGSVGRAQILHLLTSQEWLSTTEISQATGIAVRSTMIYLQDLEEAGLVAADRPPHERHGHHLQWRANSDNIAAALVSITHYLLGPTGSSDDSDHSQIEEELWRLGAPRETRRDQR